MVTVTLKEPGRLHQRPLSFFRAWSPSTLSSLFLFTCCRNASVYSSRSDTKAPSPIFSSFLATRRSTSFLLASFRRCNCASYCLTGNICLGTPNEPPVDLLPVEPVSRKLCKLAYTSEKPPLSQPRCIWSESHSSYRMASQRLVFMRNVFRRSLNARLDTFRSELVFPMRSHHGGTIGETRSALEIGFNISVCETGRDTSTDIRDEVKGAENEAGRRKLRTRHYHSERFRINMNLGSQRQYY